MMKRIVSIVLLACLLCGLFAGCKAKKQANTATDVEVVYWEAGHGREYMDKMVKAFNESQDQFHATLVSSAENRPSEIPNGDTTGDIYIGSWNVCNAYKDYLHPLDSILASKPDGENGLTIAEKLGAFAETNKHTDGHTYAVPTTIGDLRAIFYNSDMMVDADGNPYKLPNTTDELVELCLSLVSDGKVPFIHYADYWEYIFETWVAQYEGEEVFRDIHNGIYTDENGAKHDNDVRSITESQGRYEAYKVMEDILSPKGYTYTNCNSFTHTTSQTYFLAKYAVMMPSGSWVEKEMGGGAAATNVLPMKTPVVSALADKLGIRNDKHLSLIIDYVDGLTLSESDMQIVNGYSAEVIEEVRAARDIVYGAIPMHIVIPSYSNCVDGAEEFLKFMYSDKGIAIASETVGSPAGVKYSVEPELNDASWSDFMKACNEMMKDSNVISHYINRPIRYMTGTQKLYINSPVVAMTYRTDGGIMNADEYWAKESGDWEAKWPQMLIDAGLN